MRLRERLRRRSSFLMEQLPCLGYSTDLGSILRRYCEGVQPDTPVRTASTYPFPLEVYKSPGTMQKRFRLLRMPIAVPNAP